MVLNLNSLERKDNGTNFELFRKRSKNKMFTVGAFLSKFSNLKKKRNCNHLSSISL
jgi:hypothetical protein